MARILVMPDSFKGTMTAGQVCEIIAAAVRAKKPEAEIISIPVADGGEGTAESLYLSQGGELVSVVATDAMFEPREAAYWRRGETAVIEMSQIAGFGGLDIVPGPEGGNDPSHTTTYGVGEMIDHSIAAGARKVILALGGSCTNDGGLGMAAALGAEFIDENGESFVPVGATISNIKRIEVGRLKEHIAGIEFEVMCDVDNPLWGPHGAAHVFAPQKGADEEMVLMLDENLRRLSGLLEAQLGVAVGSTPGAGAAGGMGAGAIAFLGGELKAGIDVLLDLVDFEGLLNGETTAPFAPQRSVRVFTGEGRLDSQSLSGKVVVGIARRAQAAGVPVTACVGALAQDVDMDAVRACGVSDVVVSGRPGQSFEEIRKTCFEDLAAAVDRYLEENPGFADQ